MIRAIGSVKLMDRKNAGELMTMFGLTVLMAMATKTNAMVCVFVKSRLN